MSWLYQTSMKVGFQFMSMFSELLGFFLISKPGAQTTARVIAGNP